jgi:2,5-diketo-D-gluconate reductase A
MAAQIQTLQRAQHDFDPMLEREALPSVTTPTVTLLSGRQMPVLGLGTYQLTHHTVDSVAQAIEAGYRLIDTSGGYHTQRGIGEAIRDSGVRREAMFLVTKIEDTEDAFEATRANLAELKQPYADLVLIARPPERGVGESLWQG